MEHPQRREIAMTEPKELPMIFQGWGVRSVLDRLKKNTRRIIKPIPQWEEAPGNDTKDKSLWCGRYRYICGPDNDWDVDVDCVKCPYPKGTLIWVRETWQQDIIDAGPGMTKQFIVYRSDGDQGQCKWKPSIFMKREHSRIDLIVTKDRPPERVQDISEEDAIAEGAKFVDFGKNQYGQQRPGWRHDYTPVKWEDSYSSAKWSFAAIWNKINAKPKPKKRNGIITHYESYPWDEQSRDPRETINGKPHLCWPNPYVWPVEFERIKP
jgi:hypothetical protein